MAASPRDWRSTVARFLGEHSPVYLNLRSAEQPPATGTTASDPETTTTHSPTSDAHPTGSRSDHSPLTNAPAANSSANDAPAATSAAQPADENIPSSTATDASAPDATKPSTAKPDASTRANRPSTPPAQDPDNNAAEDTHPAGDLDGGVKGASSGKNADDSPMAWDLAPPRTTVAGVAARLVPRIRTALAGIRVGRSKNAAGESHPDGTGRGTPGVSLMGAGVPGSGVSDAGVSGAGVPGGGASDGGAAGGAGPSAAAKPPSAISPPVARAPGMARPPVAKPEALGTELLVETPLNRLTVFAIVAGVITGIMVALLHRLILWVERLAFGVDHFTSAAPIRTISHERLTIVLLITGVIVGLTWWALAKWGRKLVAPSQAMEGTPMPVWETMISAFTQVASVAAGTPVGRENAPRLIGALSAAGMCSKWKVAPDARRILVASAAGAGLAASFHLPLAGALFALEVLLVEMSTRTVVAAMVTSATAVAVSSFMIPQPPSYQTVLIDERLPMLICATVVGVVAGLAGHVFGLAVRWAIAHRSRGNRIIWHTLVIFALVAALSWWVPGIAGNGRWAASSILNNSLPIGLLVALILLRAAALVACFKAGVVGGTLTPSFSLGAMTGGLVGIGLHQLVPEISVGACALAGAAAFLATSMAAPMFGMIAAIEFTDMAAQGYLSMFVAVISAVVAVRLWAVAHNKEFVFRPFHAAAWTQDT